MQRLFSFKTFLSEVAMAPGQWQKPNSITGQPRLDILQHLIQKKELIELEDGDNILITRIPEALKAITQFKSDGKRFELVGKVGGKGKEVTITSSDIKKSSVFGGENGGKTGGTVGTAVAESAQCYYCSAVCNVIGASAAPEKFTEAVMKKAAKYVSATNGIDEILSSLTEDWKLSAIITANTLFNEGYIKKGHYFYRGKDLMLAVYKQAKTAYKNGGAEALPADKWNPGDIWVAKSGFNPTSLDSSSIEDYNSDILDAFLKRDCVGISLKKVVGNAHIEKYNVEPAKEKNDYHGFSISSSKKTTTLDNFFSSNSIGLFINDSFMEVRPFAFQSDYSFEISGKNARGGRIKLKDFNIAIQKQGGHPISEGDAKAHANKFDAKKLIVDKAFLKQWLKLFNDINPHGTMSYPDFEARVIQKLSDDGEKAKNWLYGKYIGTQVIHTLQSLSKKKAGDALGTLLRIAASSTDTSSAFIKVS